MADRHYPGLVATGSFNDGNQTLGTRFHFTAATVVSGFYYYSPIAQTATFGFYRVGNASRLETQTAVALTAGDNYVAFAAPITCETNKTYVVLAVVAGYAAVAAGDNVGSPYVEASFVGGPGPVDDVLNTGRMSVLSTASALATSFSDSDLTNPNGYSMQLIANWTGPGVYVSDVAPVLTVSAGADQATETGAVVTLAASPSDAVGAVTYAWAQTSGPAATLATPTAASTTFTPVSAGTYVFQVSATDDATTATDSVEVVVTDPAAPPPGVVIPWVKRNGVWERADFNDQAAGPAEPYVFHVDSYGAAGDGVTDDTAAIQACIDAAYAAAPSHNYNVVVLFGSKEYLVAGDPVVGAQYGHAQLRIPFNSASQGNKKITMTFKGAGVNSQLPYWDQDAPVSAGTVLKSTWNGTFDSTPYGAPSVLGGPTYLFAPSGAPQDDITTFSNMQVVVDGLQVQVVHGARIGGFNFKGVAQLHVVSASVISDKTRNSGIGVLPDHDESYGLLTPREGNNAKTEIESFMATGVAVGLIGQEHLSAHNLAFIYCRYGLFLQGSGNGQQWPDGTQRLITHHSWVGMLLCEAVNHWIWNDWSTGQLIVSALGGEGITRFTNHLHDPNNLLTGEAHLADIYNQTPVVNGGKRFRLVADGVTRGHKAPPVIPASEATLTNPFWRDAVVNVAGGAVTDIMVEGASTGLTSGTVVLGPGQTIALIYSAAPTWNWTVL